MGYKTIEDKIKRIEEIMKQKDVLNKELHALLVTETQVELPMGFSWNDKVLEVLKEAGNTGLDRKRMLTALEKKYGQYGVDRSKLTSSLAYLNNVKKQIEKIGRGMYRVVGQ